MSMSSPKSLALSIDCRPDAGASVVWRCEVGSVLPCGAPGRSLPFCLFVRAAPTVRLLPFERVPPLWRPMAVAEMSFEEKDFFFFGGLRRRKQ